MLDRLPSRATSSAEFDQQVYFIALDGVTQYGLFKAVTAILQNALGHAFYPSPPELRGQCDKAMEYHEQMRERIARQEQITRDREPDPPPLTADQRARHEELMRKFHAGYEKVAAENTMVLDPELVALVPDNPKSMARLRMGTA
jgi:hypothetical protein